MEFNNNITLLITANTANERILKHIRILPAIEIDSYKIARVNWDFFLKNSTVTSFIDLALYFRTVANWKESKLVVCLFSLKKWETCLRNICLTNRCTNQHLHRDRLHKIFLQPLFVCFSATDSFVSKRLFLWRGQDPSTRKIKGDGTTFC